MKPLLLRYRLAMQVIFLAGIGAVSLRLPAASQSDYENYTFTTWAGPAESPGWHDGPALDARFSNPFGGVFDALGNFYVVDRINNIIRKLSPAGVVTTVAGLAGETGSQDGAGSAARFQNPCDLAVDSARNLYVADTFNHTIRKITPAGVVTTFAGMAGVFGTNDGTGNTARFNLPTGVAADNAGNIYVTDQANSTIRKLTLAGEVSTLAGLGGSTNSTDGTGAAARFRNPYGLAVDAAGNVFVADTGNDTIRKVTPAGVVTTVAGTAGVPGTANGTGSKARFTNPFGVAVDGTGKLCVADTYNHTIRVITPAGAVTTLAGVAGEAESGDGTGTSAHFSYPTGVEFDTAGNIFVLDFNNNSIRKVTPAGVVTTIAGLAAGVGVADGTATVSRFSSPADVAVDAGGNAYVADYGNQTIRKITPTGTVSTFAGRAGTVGTANGSGGSARFNGPVALAMDSKTNLYVADRQNHAIRKITVSGAVTLLAGAVGAAGTNDDTGNKARFNNPLGIAVDAGGTVYLADSWNHTIRKVTPAGVVTTLAGKPGTSGTNDGAGAEARFNFPAGLEVDGAGNVFVADGANQTIRKITPGGVVTTIAGNAGVTGSADGVGTNALFNSPFGLALNMTGDIFVTDANNNSVRKINAAGKVTTLAGTPGLAAAVDGTGSEARFNFPEGLTVAPDGTLFVADASNHCIRRGSAAPPDNPTVDFPLERPGIIRHLDITNLTTTTWSWRIVRYPSSSSAQLSSASSRNPTLTPDLMDQYRVRFNATDATGRRVIRSLEISASESLSQPQFDGVSVSGASVILTGSGGTPNASFAVLWTTNASAPTNEWTSLPANHFDAQGKFALTNEASLPEGYYRIRVP